MDRRPIVPAAFVLLIASCQFATPIPTARPLSRAASIPPAAVKYTPADDYWPPVTASGWSRPEPLAGPVNTAGGEDSPFVTPDGKTLYFFWTPDVNVPAERQMLDGVTGIWVSHQADGLWTEPERVDLAAPGEAHLDGCDTVIGDRMYFCSIRAGGYRDIDIYIATLENGIWENVRNAGEWFNRTAEVGELHITPGYRELFFASKRAGGLGGFDLWMAEGSVDGWGDPVNLGPAVNTAGDENRPFVTEDGSELWYDAPSRAGKPGPAVFRCLRQNDGSWGGCLEIISSFAGEPALTGDANTLYFVHHYFSADMSRMLEADIYVSHRM